jgi:hypothetical protein
MNNRTRILKILNGERPDRVPWFGDLSYWGLSLNRGLVNKIYRLSDDFYKLHEDLGVGFYLQGYEPFKAEYTNLIKEIIEEKNNLRIRKIITPIGEIEERWKWLTTSYSEAPVKYFIQDVSDLRVFKYWLENTIYRTDYDDAERRYKLFKDNGVALCYLPKSPFMQLVVLYAGIENVVDLWFNHKEEFDSLVKVLQQKSNQAAEIALNSPAECLMIPENLSSEVVGKRFYHDYMEEYEKYWIERIKNKGKYSYIHMDGTLSGLISEVGAVGFRVMEALTPKPVGDLSIKEMDERVGKETIIWGGIPGVYFTASISDQEFDRLVVATLEIMKKKPRYVLGVSDQVPPDGTERRIRRVGELVQMYGEY